MEVKKMSTSSGGRKQPTAISRMKQDYMRLKRDPLPYISAEPMPNNILEWHYVVKGPENSPYHGGYYHGTLLFPREFPFKPPSIYMLTPNGRFRTNTRLCLSISDFHPDTWNPTWCVGTILTGLLSFMLETTPTLGSVESTQKEKQQLARKSLAFNLKNPNFRDLFPDICDEINKRLQKQQRFLERQSKGAALAAAPSSATANINVNDATAADASTTGLVGSHNINESLAANGSVEQINSRVSSSSTSKKSFINWPALYSNLVIGLSFAIFALIVNYVIKNLNQE